MCRSGAAPSPTGSSATSRSRPHGAPSSRPASTGRGAASPRTSTVTPTFPTGPTGCASPKSVDSPRTRSRSPSRCPPSCAATFRFTPGQHVVVADEIDGETRPPELLDLHRRRLRGAAGRGPTRRRRPLLDLRQQPSAGRRRTRGHPAERAVHPRPRSGGTSPPRRRRRRQRDHPGDLHPEQRARGRARQPRDPDLRQPRHGIDDVRRRAGHADPPVRRPPRDCPLPLARRAGAGTDGTHRARERRRGPPRCRPAP